MFFTCITHVSVTGDFPEFAVWAKADGASAINMKLATIPIRITLRIVVCFTVFPPREREHRSWLKTWGLHNRTKAQPENISTKLALKQCKNGY
jgi:hypothetical protein